jgi:outer membrane protein TolC
MKRIISFLSLSLVVSICMAQITLQECHDQAKSNYPVIRQYKLVEQTRDYTIDNASKGNLPQLSLSGKATYQSEVTKIPVTIPGYNIQSQARDQYNIVLDVTQNVYDGGVIGSQKRIAKAEADVQREQLNVSMYDINNRVDQLFFGVLLIDEQIKQNLLLQNDLKLSRSSIEGLMRNGVANQTDVDAIAVEQLSAVQQEQSLHLSRRSYLNMLGLFIGRQLGDSTIFTRPSADMPSTLDNRRPELQLYNAQTALLNERLRSLDTRLRPHFSLFAEGGYGRPGLNMLKRDFDPYYMVGARMSWNLGSLYTRKNDRQLLETSRQQVESNRATFLFNTNLQTTSESTAIRDLRQKIQTDDAIVALRANIRSKAERKVANGTLTVNEMLRQINAENEARQSKALHEIQLLQEIYKLRDIGNL